MTAAQTLFWVLIYVLVCRACLAWTAGKVRLVSFALINVAAVWWLLLPTRFILNRFHFIVFLIYLGLVVFQYFTLHRFALQPRRKSWIAFSTPLVALVLIKYVPLFLGPVWRRIGTQPATGLEVYYFFGISYLAFRSSLLVIEVRNRVVPMPGFWEYLSFCFFVPTMTVGPINSYSRFSKGFGAPDRTDLPLARCALRILVGVVKFIVLASVWQQLGYQGLLLGGNPHHRVDLFVAAVFYYLYLYCNFSGYCDVAIGVAGLLGFPVEENFSNPLLARNLQEFWTRWHMTLSRYMRDIVFTPLSKFLIGHFGISHANSAIALSIFVVFLLVGIWHGAGWNYVIFGAANGIGLVIVHYYGIGLKQWLGKDGYKRYLQNAWIRGVGVVMTFSYFAVCLFFFANDFKTMRKIFSVLV